MRLRTTYQTVRWLFAYLACATVAAGLIVTVTR